jgi:glycosyltransferase involved in cell wall biosynthesis
VPVWERRRENWRAGAGAAAQVALAQARLLRTRRSGFDALIVGYPGHLDLAAARRVAGRRPVVFNPLVSLSDSFVEDRGRFGRGSVAARVLAAIDRQALRAADAVVADTNADADFLAQLARIPRERVRVCFVGAEERIFQPARERPPELGAIFVGKLIPLHGLETILRAAELAPEVTFTIVGSGQLDDLIRARTANVRHIPWLEYAQIPRALHSSACALGIFGDSAKAHRVIPNKVFQALACAVAVITGDTPAATELLTDGVDALLVPARDAEALADAVRRLASDDELRCRLAASGHATYVARASESVLGAQWRGLVEELV